MAREATGAAADAPAGAGPTAAPVLDLALADLHAVSVETFTDAVKSLAELRLPVAGPAK